MKRSRRPASPAPASSWDRRRAPRQTSRSAAARRPPGSTSRRFRRGSNPTTPTWAAAGEPAPKETQMNAPHPAALMREQLYREMDPHNLTPLWEVLHALVPQQPRTPCVPALWKYGEVRPFLMRAGQAITAEDAVRRVLILLNPSL